MFEAFVTALITVLIYQCVGVAVFLTFEIAFPKARIPLKDRAAGFIFLLAAAPLAGLSAVILTGLQSLLHITPVGFHLGVASSIIGATVLALWVDLQFYALHRFEHRFLWRFHAVHHSIRNLSAANSYHHWTEAVWLTAAAIPLLFVDLQVAPALGLLLVAFHYQQFYIHTSAKPHFGPLRWLLIDNRYHRIHHSTQPEHHDKNFGAMTPLWDWLFGTFYMPKSSEWPDVGLADLDEPQGLKEWAIAPWRLRDREGADLARSPRGRRGEVLLDRRRSA
jgi:sterol desaturase/sphingolipid hydroxylase (fatty acid hydroxylase superfamily)